MIFSSRHTFERWLLMPAVEAAVYSHSVHPNDVMCVGCAILTILIDQGTHQPRFHAEKKTRFLECHIFVYHFFSVSSFVAKARLTGHEYRWTLQYLSCSRRVCNRTSAEGSLKPSSRILRYSNLVIVVGPTGVVLSFSLRRDSSSIVLHRVIQVHVRRSETLKLRAVADNSAHLSSGFSISGLCTAGGGRTMRAGDSSTIERRMAAPGQF